MDLGESKYLVESETTDDKWYMCDMKSGYCTCPVGGNCSPCKHKSAVSKHFQEAHFTVAPSHDSRQRALYHYIALGKTLPAHMYRSSGDDCSVEDIEHFIKEKLSVEEKNNDYETRQDEEIEENENQIEVEENPIEDEIKDEIENQSDEEKEDMGSEDGEEYDADLVAKRFAEAFDSYKAEILRQHARNSQDPSINKAMMAITKNMNKSLRCTPLTLQNQMHNFAIGTVGRSRSKRGGVIKVNPPSLSRRTFKVPGRGPAPLGRPPKNKAGQTQMFVTVDEDIVSKSDKVFRPQIKKPHNLAKTVESNESAPNRHTKQ